MVFAYTLICAIILLRFGFVLFTVFVVFSKDLSSYYVYMRLSIINFPTRYYTESYNQKITTGTHSLIKIIKTKTAEINRSCVLRWRCLKYKPDDFHWCPIAECATRVYKIEWHFRADLLREFLSGGESVITVRGWSLTRDPRAETGSSVALMCVSVSVERTYQF